jgi:hypothetical protein
MMMSDKTIEEMKAAVLAKQTMNAKATRLFNTLSPSRRVWVKGNQ